MSGDLTPDDVRHWDLSVIHQVFETAAKRRDSKHQLGEALGHARTRTNDWHGESGDAFREELDKPRTDVNAAGRESDRVYSAVRNAEMWVSGAKVELGDVDAGAETYGWTVTPGWKIDGGDNNTNWMYDPLVLSEEQQRLQEELDKAHSDAQTADHELATAVRGAVGDVQLDEHGHEVPQAPGPQNASNSVPGPDGHPPYDYHDGQQHPPPTMIPGAPVIPLLDNPPNFPPVGPGAQRDQNWQRYLNGFNADGSRRVSAGVPPAALPKPEAVQDKGLRAIGAAGRQQGISYAWGANQSPYGPTKGHGDGGGEATRNHDDQRTGFDCGGLVRFSEFQATGRDVFEHTGPDKSGTDLIDNSKYLDQVKGGISAAQPGDVLVFGNSGHEAFSGAGTHHTGIYLGNGVIINAPGSGEAVRTDALMQWKGEPTDVLRPK